MQPRLVDDRLLDLLIEQLLCRVLLLLTGFYLLRKLVLFDELDLFDQLGQVVAYLAGFFRVGVRQVIVFPLEAQFLQIWQGLTPFDLLFDACAHITDLLHHKFFPFFVLFLPYFNLSAGHFHFFLKAE